jgi:SagB-type dehydrogenase family enzyme
MAAEHGNAAAPQKRSELWSLREDVSVELEPDQSVLLRSRWGDVTIHQPSQLVREALRRMRLGPISLKNVVGVREATEAGQTAAAAEAPERQTQLYRVLEQLQPLVVRSLKLESGQPLMSVVPITVGARFRPVPLAADVPVRLSVFAGLRTDGREYLLESPLALHRVLLHRPEAAALVASLASPVPPAALAAAWLAEGTGERLATDVLEYLAAAGMVVPAQATEAGSPVFAEETDPALAGWSPTDLTFHAFSTLGRHDHNFGVTYPGGPDAPTEPVVKPQASRYISLHRPRWEDLREADPPLTAVIEGRRSVRRYATEPMTVAELGELLYRTARVRSLITIPPDARGDAGGAGAGVELSDRPYPSGGACYELELYVTAGNCAGLRPGIYHYDPLGHRLEPVNAGRAAVGELLGCARVAAAMEHPPPVLITMTARFGRLSSKYEGLAYRLALMHVGVLTQSLYLVCTAMHLAPCALGAVSVDAAARAFGTDWRTEPCVGQFIVGSDPGPADRDTSWWREINDARWADLARSALG